MLLTVFIGMGTRNMIEAAKENQGNLKVVCVTVSENVK